jgi:hypothetical protein
MMDESKTPRHDRAAIFLCAEGFGFVHHSIAILYHEVPNPYITIRNFFIAVGPWVGAERGWGQSTLAR